jgi:ribulose-phosphate 3-epimerase
MKHTKVSVSILSSDYAKFGQEVAKVNSSGADMIHFDIMDGHFVPNITFGAGLVKSLRTHSKMPFDVHLMISEPEKYIDEFARAGSDYITVHQEAVVHLDRTLEQIKAAGAKCGVSLVPSTPANTLKYVMDKVDLILVMTVNPGFGGQKFMDNQVEKIRKIREMIDKSGREIILSVDGGINPETAKIVTNAGADMLISGAYLFAHNDFKEAVSQLKS